MLPDESLLKALDKKFGWLSTFVSVPAATSTEGRLGVKTIGFSSGFALRIAALTSRGLDLSTDGLGCGLLRLEETLDTLLLRVDLSELEESLELMLESQDVLRPSFFNDNLLCLGSSGGVCLEVGEATAGCFGVADVVGGFCTAGAEDLGS